MDLAISPCPNDTFIFCHLMRAMPELQLVFADVEELNQRASCALNGARVLVVGLSYKKNINDTRESPSFLLIELLETQGARCDVHDPFVPVIPKTREHAALAGRESITLSAQALGEYDAVLISTDHDDIDYALIANHAKLVVDTRNVCTRKGFCGANIVKA